MIAVGKYAALLAKAGEAISATLKWNPLVQEVTRRRWRAGPGVRIRETPNATVISYQTSGPTIVSHPLKVTVTPSGDDAWLVGVAPGLIAGQVPKIEGTALTTKVDDEPPLLEVSASDFKDDLAHLYARVTIASTGTWFDQAVDILVLREPPLATAWQGFKLLAFLQREGGTLTARQMAFFNIGHATSNRRSSGMARHWWWAVS